MVDAHFFEDMGWEVWDAVEKTCFLKCGEEMTLSWIRVTAGGLGWLDDEAMPKGMLAIEK
jgi:hypothetical protein